VYISPAVQNLSERLEQVLTEIVRVELFFRRSQLIEMAPRMLKNTVSIVYEVVIVGLTLVGTFSADILHMLS
jgi:5'(3')-deoxyribonucleotidase